MRHSGVWCCSEKAACAWPGVTFEGLAWGTIPTKSPWRKCHDERCRGTLIQLIAPCDGANNREGIDKQGNIISAITKGKVQS